MVTLKFVQCGEDTDGVEYIVKRGGEVRVDGEIMKTENRGDDGGVTSHRQSWRSYGCWKRDLNMMSYRRKLAH